MFRGKSIAVVVPAYNEEGFVGDVIDEIPEFVDRLYVVDDCSTDGTWGEIQQYVREANRERRGRSPPAAEHGEPKGAVHGGSTVVDGGESVVDCDSVVDSDCDGDSDSIADGDSSQWAHAIRHEENSGVGAAIKTGYRRALRDDIDVTAVMNGDGQMDPDILDRIIAPVVEGNAAYAKGNRLSSADHRAGMTPWRFFGNALLTFLTKVASGYWKVQDPQNGYTAISAEALERIPVDDLYDRYGFVNDVLVKLNAHGLPVADVTMRAVYSDEESSIGYADFIPRVSRLLLWNFLWRLKTKYLVRDFHPLVFFYLLGVVSIGAGFALVVLSLVASTQSLLLGSLAALMVLFGGGFVLSAMVFDMFHNERLEYREHA